MSLATERLQFSGNMTYPDPDEDTNANTVTKIQGEIKEQTEGGRAGVTWKESGYAHRGRRSIDFDGEYSATVTGDVMDGGWYHEGQLIARFEMTANRSR